MENDSANIVRGIYDAFGRGDVEAALGAMADDIAWYEAEGMPYGGVYHGPGAVAQGVFAPADDRHPRLHRDARGVHRRPATRCPWWPAIAAPRRPRAPVLDLPVVHVWDVRDGKAARFRQFADTVKFLEAVPTSVGATR